MLHKKCHGRLKQQLYCPSDNEVVERADMIKGYEHVKNQYVLFTEEELDALESPKNNSVEITEFVPASTVDWIYITKTYYLGPDKGGDRAYKLLAEAMGRTDKIAVARYFARGKEQLVLVRPYRQGLVLHYVYYANEVRSFDEVDLGGEVAFKPTENELADKLILQLAVEAFQPDKYKDEYVERVKCAVEHKIAGQEIAAPPGQPAAQIIDLFEALKRSLTNGGEKQPVKPPKKAVPRKALHADKPATG
jgi:DNA end-binding protein Ku